MSRDDVRWPSPGAAQPRTGAMVAPTTDALLAMHKRQVHRDRWPAWEAFSPDRYPADLRRSAAWQWAGRARAEHGSIHQFSAVSRALCELRVPVSLLGALARLITDEVRHAELCARIALAYYPEGLPEETALFAWPTPRAPWPDAPDLSADDDDPAGALVWATDAIVTACCFGETLSVPMLRAISTVATCELAQAVADQILRDEHLHARFGWEAVATLLPHIDEAGRATLQDRLADHMAAFEASTCVDVRLEDLIDEPSLTIHPGDPSEPNLGVLTHRQYAMIFYATMEQEIFPELQALGFDPGEAWGRRAAGG